MKAVEVVQHCHVERSGNGAFFLIAADVYVVVVGTAVGQPVDQPWITMKGENDRLIFGEELVEIRVAQPMGVLFPGLELHEVDDIDDTDFQVRQTLRIMDTAASVSSVGTSPQQAMTTSGKAP